MQPAFYYTDSVFSSRFWNSLCPITYSFAQSKILQLHLPVKVDLGREEALVFRLISSLTYIPVLSKLGMGGWGLWRRHWSSTFSSSSKKSILANFLCPISLLSRNQWENPIEKGGDGTNKSTNVSQMFMLRAASVFEPCPNATMPSQTCTCKGNLDTQMYVFVWPIRMLQSFVGSVISKPQVIKQTFARDVVGSP